MLSRKIKAERWDDMQHRHDATKCFLYDILAPSQTLLLPVFFFFFL